MSDISLRQLKTQAKKFGFQQVDQEALDLVNASHQKLIKKLLTKKQKQRGGRVSLPLEYFSGTPSGNYSDNNTFTNIAATDSAIRQSIPLNDPSGGLATDKAFAPFVGGGCPKFEVSEKVVKASLKQLQDQQLHRKQQQELAKHAKTKFETLMTEALNKVSKKANLSTLQESDLRKALSLKKYQVQLS
jgi:hypothetical protein